MQRTGKMPCEDEGKVWREGIYKPRDAKDLAAIRSEERGMEHFPPPAQLCLQNSETIQFCCLSSSVCGTLFQLHQMANKHNFNCAQKELFAFPLPCSILFPFPNFFGVLFFSYMSREFLIIISDQLEDDFHVNSFAKFLTGIHLFPLSSLQHFICIFIININKFSLALLLLVYNTYLIFL